MASYFNGMIIATSEDTGTHSKVYTVPTITLHANILTLLSDGMGCIVNYHQPMSLSNTELLNNELRARRASLLQERCCTLCMSHKNTGRLCGALKTCNRKIPGSHTSGL